MAIDTENKRRSASGFFLTLIPPVADGTINASDRAHVSGFYSGIALDPPVAETGIQHLLLLGVG